MSLHDLKRRYEERLAQEAAQRVTLDLTRPENRNALFNACTLTPDERAYYLVHMGDDEGPCVQFCRALSSPSHSAALVRALLEGCGVVLPHDGEGDEPGSAGEADVRADDGLLVVWVRLDGAWVRRDRTMAQVPALILRLLDANRESAIAALREAGR